ncbi:hypothetical protein J2Z43_001998 [Clostridioides mangenotii]|uniref:Uncharacterized protein n=1 Tax=Metaclostridioides mangenotii TaxID=1540 RepID=A0ABS4ECD0_9FIRM|nr:hypothetical protein [Clostridioides mangenotii]
MDIFDEKGIKTMLIAEMQEDLIDLYNRINEY